MRDGDLCSGPNLPQTDLNAPTHPPLQDERALRPLRLGFALHVKGSRRTNRLVSLVNALLCVYFD